MSRTATFTVVLSKASTRRTSISYRTVAVSAEAQSDFTPAEGTLNFEPGELMKTITVQVRDHDDAQPAERFLVTLYNPHGMRIARVDGVCDIPAGSGGQPAEQNGPLILNGLITNSYHDELGRSGYNRLNSAVEHIALRCDIEHILRCPRVFAWCDRPT